VYTGRVTTCGFMWGIVRTTSLGCSDTFLCPNVSVLLSQVDEDVALDQAVKFCQIQLATSAQRQVKQNHGLQRVSLVHHSSYCSSHLHKKLNLLDLSISLLSKFSRKILVFSLHVIGVVSHKVVTVLLQFMVHEQYFREQQQPSICVSSMLYTRTIC